MQDTNLDNYESDCDAMLEETLASFNEDLYCESNGDWLIGK